MKNYKLFILALFFTSLGFAQNAIEGDWMLEKVIENGNTQNINRPLRFAHDGQLYMMEAPIGSWKLNTTDNTLFLNTGRIEGKHQIIKNKAGQLVVKLDNTTMYFTKIDKEKIALENKKSGLEGVWELNDKIDNYIKLYIRFTLPDNFVLVEKNGNSISTAKGSWTVNTLKKTLKLVGRLEHLKGVNTLVEVSNDKLLIKHNAVLYHFTKIPNTDEVEHLTFSYEDFYDENGNYKYENEAQKLPWQDAYKIKETLSKLKQLVYVYSELINNIEVFGTQTLYANIEADKENENLKIDDIFQGFDRESLPEEAEMPVLVYDEYSSPLFPVEENPFRIVKQETINVPAGNFLCTVVEIAVDSDTRQKIWFINDKPGVVAKIIREKEGVFAYYKKFELK